MRLWLPIFLLLCATTSHLQAQFGTGPDFSSVINSMNRLTTTVDNATNKVPEIVGAANRISDSISNATAMIPGIVLQIDKTNNNIQQIIIAFNDFTNKISTSYIAGTVAAIVGVSLSLAAAFVSSRYWINRLCIDKTATQADIKELSERLTAVAQMLKEIAQKLEASTPVVN